ncbi:hypothetical protein [Alteraurantiacibacter aquimixticola]|uniref:DUF2214 domain-containing protein n=1 Tax=Alteraurantiacibacter aquimixticola TaxID=2489173 RepID=A0A4T3EYI1_9SPHN|nr:hypothetical protein [Alteraurantiacibacter aquimixticola]TIX49666.1 hypothetical protein E5222_12640 [Alteraurantiacibacter aquimixticola]
MMDALAWIEQTGLSRFVREDFYAYFVLLIFHAWGMALLAGGGVAVSLRVLGVAKQTPLPRWRAVFPWMWLGAALAIISGLGLLAGYPAKALTNWVFALKFACLFGASWLVVHMAKVSFNKGIEPVGLVKLQAGLALLLWLGGIASGKLLLYTNTMLMTSDVLGGVMP